MLDKSNEAHDRRLASHILNMYCEEYIQYPASFKPVIDRDTLTKYISFSRRYVHP